MLFVGTSSSFPAPLIDLLLQNFQNRFLSKKQNKILPFIEPFRGQALDARYLGYFHCFNHGLFFEAHEVLEDLWLTDRKGKDGAFYKGLIQLAGAFVHLDKRRPGPAAALFRLSLANFKSYSPIHHQLDLNGLSERIEKWLETLSADGEISERHAIRLRLET